MESVRDSGFDSKPIRDPKYSTASAITRPTISTTAGPLPSETCPPEACGDAGAPDENAALPPENRVAPETWLEAAVALEPVPLDCAPCNRTEHPDASMHAAAIAASVHPGKREKRAVTIRVAMAYERAQYIARGPSGCPPARLVARRAGGPC